METYTQITWKETRKFPFTFLVSVQASTDVHKYKVTWNKESIKSKQTVTTLVFMAVFSLGRFNSWTLFLEFVLKPTFTR